MMQEIMDQEERVMLDQIAKLTEENHVEWACDEYNPIGFLDKDDDSEQSACICQMFQFSAVLNGFHYELELAEYINVPSGKIDLSVTLTRNDDEHFLKIDSILSVELATSQEKEAKDIDNIAAVRLAKRLVPLAVKTDAVAEAFSWASFINQTGISKALLNNNLTKLGENCVRNIGRSTSTTLCLTTLIKTDFLPNYESEAPLQFTGGLCVTVLCYS